MKPESTALETKRTEKMHYRAPEVSLVCAENQAAGRTGAFPARASIVTLPTTFFQGGVP
jgi:hypothetical protein